MAEEQNVCTECGYEGPEGPGEDACPECGGDMESHQDWDEEELDDEDDDTSDLDELADEWDEDEEDIE